MYSNSSILDAQSQNCEKISIPKTEVNITALQDGVLLSQHDRLSLLPASRQNLQ